MGRELFGKAQRDRLLRCTEKLQKSVRRSTFEDFARYADKLRIPPLLQHPVGVIYASFSDWKGCNSGGGFINLFKKVYLNNQIRSNLSKLVKLLKNTPMEVFQQQEALRTFVLNANGFRHQFILSHAKLGNKPYEHETQMMLASLFAYIAAAGGLKQGGILQVDLTKRERVQNLCQNIMDVITFSKSKLCILPEDVKMLERYTYKFSSMNDLFGCSEFDEAIEKDSRLAAVYSKYKTAYESYVTQEKHRKHDDMLTFVFEKLPELLFLVDPNQNDWFNVGLYSYEDPSPDPPSQNQSYGFGSRTRANCTLNLGITNTKVRVSVFSRRPAFLVTTGIKPSLGVQARMSVC